MRGGTRTLGVKKQELSGDNRFEATTNHNTVTELREELWGERNVYTLLLFVAKCTNRKCLFRPTHIKLGNFHIRKFLFFNKRSKDLELGLTDQTVTMFST